MQQHLVLPYLGMVSGWATEKSSGIRSTERESSVDSVSRPIQKKASFEQGEKLGNWGSHEYNRSICK